MIRIDLLHKQKIKWEGITDFPEFYKYLKLWLQDNGYAKERSLEKKYIERAKPEGKKHRAKTLKLAIVYVSTACFGKRAFARRRRNFHFN